MDARLNIQDPASSVGHKTLCRIFVRSVMPVLKGSAPQNAQVILNCIRILSPDSDLRRMQALVYYRLGQYVDAARIFSEFDDPESRAMGALCQRAMGEPSWLGVAEVIRDTGHQGALAILEPWLGKNFEHIQGDADATGPDSSGPAGERGIDARASSQSNNNLSRAMRV